MIRVDVTPRAARRVRSLIAGDERTAQVDRIGLRVSVLPAPSNAEPYRLSLAMTRRPGELALPRHGFDVLVESADAGLVDGLRIDYVDSEAGSGFLVDRPTPRSAPGPGIGAVDPASVPEPGTSPDLERRVGEALEEVRPVLVGDGGDVDLISVADGAAYIRLQGACSGCGAAWVTLTHLIETTVARAVPEVPRTVVVA